MGTPMTTEQVLRANLARLLTNIGDKAQCRGCQADIFWVTHKNGKKTPYTVEGLNHFIDCPAAERFKKKEPSNGL